MFSIRLSDRQDQFILDLLSLTNFHNDFRLFSSDQLQKICTILLTFYKIFIKSL